MMQAPATVEPLPLPAIQPPRLPAGSTVAVAMSGGVDSSVAAALCVAGGYRVVGIMLSLWAEPGARAENRCCHPGAVEDARDVAAILGIPFQVLDARQLFHQRVVQPFLQAAAQGDTPNPCFSCNQRVRFGYLLEQALALGADFLATGHYARVGEGAVGRRLLLRGLDPLKDQSYMLHRLDQAQLARAVFPVGGYPKPQVRRLAAHFGLPAATRADSMDLCWTGEDGVAGFLARHLPPETMQAGDIVDRAGRVLGRHQGLPRYTLGQRKGIGVAAAAPLYVVDQDTEAGRLVLGLATELMTQGLRLDRLHWVSGEAPDLGANPGDADLADRAGGDTGGDDREHGDRDRDTSGLPPLQAMIRYRAPLATVRLCLEAGGAAARLRFAAPQRAPTPGQGLVLYRGEVCLGGARIDRRLEDAELADLPPPSESPP